MMKLVTSNFHKTLNDQLEKYPGPKRVDIIMSYIKKEGLDTAWPVFEKLVKHKTDVRIITTFQPGITDVESIERLARLDKTTVYVF